MIKIAGLLLMITGALLLLIPHVLFPTCALATGGEPGLAARMICSQTGEITGWLGVLTGVTALVFIFAPVPLIRKLALLLAAAVAVVVPYIYLQWPGVCGGLTMPCRVGTLPAVLLTAGGQLCAVFVGGCGMRRR